MKFKIALFLLPIIILAGCGEKEEQCEGVLEGGKCKIKVEEHEATYGPSCDDSYRLEDHICILEDVREIVKEYSCEEGLELGEDTCSGKVEKDATIAYSCEMGMVKGDKCQVKALIGDATASCSKYPDPVILRVGKCYLGIPRPADGCENGDEDDGKWCYDLDVPRTPSYKCPSGTLEDGKCFNIIESNANEKISCEDGFTLKDKTCVKEIKNAEAIVTEKCEEGYKRLDDKCVLEIERVAAVDTYKCEESFVLEDTKCVKYKYK